MNTFGNICLVLFIIVLVAVITLKPGQDNSINHDKISQLNVNDVEKIKIMSTDQDDIVFYKENTTWWKKLPGNNIPVNPEQLNPLFNLLNSDSQESFEVSIDQLPKYQLATPRLSIQYNNFMLSFGGSEPLKHRRYVLIGQTVHLITDLHYHLILKSIRSL